MKNAAAWIAALVGAGAGMYLVSTGTFSAGKVGVTNKWGAFGINGAIVLLSALTLGMGAYGVGLAGTPKVG